jgi:hypothetical protein
VLFLPTTRINLYHHIYLTDSRTTNSWRRILLEKLTGRKIVNNFSGTGKFIAAFTRAGSLFLSQTRSNPIQVSIPFLEDPV